MVVFFFSLCKKKLNIRIKTNKLYNGQMRFTLCIDGFYTFVLKKNNVKTLPQKEHSVFGFGSIPRKETEHIHFLLEFFFLSNALFLSYLVTYSWSRTALKEHTTFLFFFFWQISIYNSKFWDSYQFKSRTFVSVSIYILFHILFDHYLVKLIF